MDTNGGRTFAVHVLKDSSPQIFGEVIFVTTVSESKGNIKQKFNAECFVLAERGEKRLTRKTLSLSFERSPPEAWPRVDSNFMFDAALDVCKAQVGAMLLTRFDQTKDWSIYALPFLYELADDPVVQLARVWILNRFGDELKKIHKKSTCNDLKLQLQMIIQMPSIVEKEATS